MGKLHSCKEYYNGFRTISFSLNIRLRIWHCRLNPFSLKYFFVMCYVNAWLVVSVSFCMCILISIFLRLLFIKIIMFLLLFFYKYSSKYDHWVLVEFSLFINLQLLSIWPMLWKSLYSNQCDLNVFEAFFINVYIYFGLASTLYSLRSLYRHFIFISSSSHF